MPNNEPRYSLTQKPTPPRQPKPGEQLFEFVRASDGAPIRVELRFNEQLASRHLFLPVKRTGRTAIN